MVRVASQSQTPAREGGVAACSTPSVFGNLTNPFHLDSCERTLGREGKREPRTRINREQLQLQLFLFSFPAHVALRATKTINTQIPSPDWPPSQVTKLQPCPPPFWPLASPSASGRPGNRQTSDGLGHGRAVLFVPADPFSPFSPLLLALASTETPHLK